MAKIKLGSRPKEFKRVVKFPLLEGGEGAIECKFKYRTRTEFGAFIDKMVEAAGATQKPDEEKFSLATVLERSSGQNVEYLMQVLEGWNLDEELTPVALQQLCDEYPGAATAIMETYRTSVTEGRLGN